MKHFCFYFISVFYDQNLLVAIMSYFTSTFYEKYAYKTLHRIGFRFKRQHFSLALQVNL